jgi:hypothetical protein
VRRLKQLEDENKRLKQMVAKISQNLDAPGPDGIVNLFL